MGSKISEAVDAMRDVYMTRTQREAFDRIAAAAHLQGEAVPVAWQVRDEVGGWTWCQADQGCYQMVKRHRPHDARALYEHPQPAELNEQHPDDLAVDTFANAMKSKMTVSRWRGRSGWDDRSQCSQSQLSAMLRAHVEKGDPVDVANFCMMLSLRGEGIEPVAASASTDQEQLIRLRNDLHIMAKHGVKADWQDAAIELVGDVTKLIDGQTAPKETE